MAHSSNNKTSPEGESLSMNDLVDVHTKLYDVRSKWFDIGMALSISYGTLESIKSEQHFKNSDCLREVLAHRIQLGSPLTWNDISSCLRHPTVEQGDLANKIDQESSILKPENQQLETSLKTTEKDSEDTIQLIEKSPVSIEGLRHDSVVIESKFAKLVASMYLSLITRNISKDSLVACLAGFSCLTKVYDGSNQSMFHKQRNRFTDPSATLASVWIIVGQYFSFFDYEVLELITDILGSDVDKQNFAEYRKEFESYARRRLFIDETSSEDKPSQNQEKSVMFVILDPSYDDCEIGHLKKLQEKLSHLLNLEKGVLRLCKVKKGSIQLVFEIMDSIISIIFPLSPYQKLALCDLGVVLLSCGGYYFEAKEYSGEASCNEDSTNCHQSDLSVKEYTPLQQYTQCKDAENKDEGISMKGGHSSGTDESVNLPSEAGSQRYDYVRMIRDYLKTPETPYSDSGIGKTRTRTPTMSSQLTLDSIAGDDFQELPKVIDEFNTNEPPPLGKIASAKLHPAVFNGELNKVRFLIEVFHCSPLTVNRKGHTALHTAAACGELGILRFFVEERVVNSAVESVSRETVLHCSAENGQLSVVKYLVETQMVDPLILDEQLLSPLHSACKSGNMNTFKYLIKECEPHHISERTSSGRTLLHYAATSGSSEIISFLLSSNYKANHFLEKETVNIQDKWGYTALYFGSYYGHLEVVQLLLTMSAEVDMQAKDGFTALFAASQEGHCEIVKVLLEAKADINMKTYNDNSTALYWASRQGYDDVVMALLAAKANVDTQNKWGESPLIAASYNGHQKCVNSLIEAGARVNIQNEKGLAALHAACYEGHSTVVKRLLRANADFNIKNFFGESPLFLASFNGQLKCIELLIEAGVNINASKDDGSTALYVAAERGHLKVVQLLIAAKSQVDSQTKNGATALHIACQEGNLKIAETLIAANASVNAHDNNLSLTPLMLAAQKGHSAVVSLLLSKKAQLKLKNYERKTAYDLASMNGHDKVCQQLSQARSGCSIM